MTDGNALELKIGAMLIDFVASRTKDVDLSVIGHELALAIHAPREGFIIGIHPSDQSNAGILQRLLHELIEAVGQPPGCRDLPEYQPGRGSGGTEHIGIRELTTIHAKE
jgi:hypothetical protein